MAGIPAILRKKHCSTHEAETLEVQRSIREGKFPGATELIDAIRAWEEVRLQPRSYAKDMAHDDLAGLLSGLSAIRAVGHFDHGGHRYRATDDGSFTRTPLRRRSIR